MTCSNFHGLVEGTAFVHMSCSCDVHPRIRGEGTVFKARAKGA